MYTNTATYNVGDYVNAAFLNANARDNMNALFAQTSTPSLLNPMISGIISYTTNFDPTPPFVGDSLAVGAISLEATTDNSVTPPTRQYRVAITYALATNSTNGCVLKLKNKVLGAVGKPYPSGFSATTLATFATRTTKGTYTEVSSWKAMASNVDEVWEIQVEGSTNDDPMPRYSDLGICFQIRTI